MRHNAQLSNDAILQAVMGLQLGSYPDFGN